jgi:hypothetical protein
MRTIEKSQGRAFLMGKDISNNLRVPLLSIVEAADVEQDTHGKLIIKIFFTVLNQTGEEIRIVDINAIKYDHPEFNHYAPLTIGYRSEISLTTKNSLLKSGAYHIVAPSELFSITALIDLYKWDRIPKNKTTREFGIFFKLSIDHYSLYRGARSLIRSSLPALFYFSQAKEHGSVKAELLTLDKKNLHSIFSSRAPDRQEILEWAENKITELTGSVETLSEQTQISAKSRMNTWRDGLEYIDGYREHSEGKFPYEVFISHASEDKEAVAYPLFEALKARQISVWLDSVELTLGDNLSRKIDEGLANCRYGIVILSPDFLRKGWPQRELDGLVARETATGHKSIIPVWHGMDEKMLLEFSPMLAGRLATDSRKGVNTMVDEILRVLSGDR